MSEEFFIKSGVEFKFTDAYGSQKEYKYEKHVWPQLLKRRPKVKFTGMSVDGNGPTDYEFVCTGRRGRNWYERLMFWKKS